MRVLGIDQGIFTGWCIYDSETKQVIESDVEKLRNKGGDSHGLIFLRFRKWLEYILDLQDIELVGYELPHYRGRAPTNIGVGLTTRIEEVCEAHEPRVPFGGVHTNTLKKWATGKGNASKEDMIVAAAQMKYGVTSDDEADACLIAKWTAEEYG